MFKPSRLDVQQLQKQIEPEPIGADFPLRYAKVRAALEMAGTKIGDRDTIIAAHAVSLGAIVVTRNAGEFSRIAGLICENWEVPPQPPSTAP